MNASLTFKLKFQNEFETVFYIYCLTQDTQILLVCFHTVSLCFDLHLKNLFTCREAHIHWRNCGFPTLHFTGSLCFRKVKGETETMNLDILFCGKTLSQIICTSNRSIQHLPLTPSFGPVLVTATNTALLALNCKCF